MKDLAFNQTKYQNQWKKENMKTIGAAYKSDFVHSFKMACDKLNISQSKVFKNAMLDIINKAK